MKKPYFRIEWLVDTDDFEGWKDCGFGGERYTLEDAQAAFEEECGKDPQLPHRLVVVLRET